MDMDKGSACTSIDQRNSQMQGSDPFNAHVEDPAQKLSYCTQISRGSSQPLQLELRTQTGIHTCASG